MSPSQLLSQARRQRLKWGADTLVLELFFGLWAFLYGLMIFAHQGDYIQVNSLMYLNQLPYLPESAYTVFAVFALVAGVMQIYGCIWGSITTRKYANALHSMFFAVLAMLSLYVLGVSGALIAYSLASLSSVYVTWSLV